MPQNTGSFGAAIGGSDALTQAMQRRGMDSSALNQVSPAAPTGPSPVAPGIPPDANMGAAVPTEAPPMDAGAAMGTMEEKQTPRSAEMEIALKALAQTVKTENKIAEALIGSG